MARILVGSWAVRYPVGGNLSWTLQWLLGFRRLGHDVYLVERSGYPNSCFDPAREVMSDDCSHGTAAVDTFLGRYDLGDRWCFVDAGGRYHGLSQGRVRELFASAELFVDLGTHGAWLPEADDVGCRVLIDGEPGARQMKMEKRSAAGEPLPVYDFYYSNGANVGTGRSSAPTAGKPWRPIYNPVLPELFKRRPVPADAPFTTVMNWKPHKPVTFRGAVYGQKDVEFARFLDLPRRTAVPLEVAVAGKVPCEQLRAAGWRVRNALGVTLSFDAYRDYIHASRGEFSVCKNVYVTTGSGWFSDRSAAYLAAGRPVVLQETGFSDRLPCGRGLFAVRTVEEAAAAIDTVCGDYERHSRWASEIAQEYLSAPRVLKRFLEDIGV
jgi:hypothetical protein